MSKEKKIIVRRQTNQRLGQMPMIACPKNKILWWTDKSQITTNTVPGVM